MSSDRSLGLFGKLILVYLYFLLWMQFGSEFKYQAIAVDQLLDQVDVDALNNVVESLELEIGRSTIDTEFCNGTNSSSFYDYDLGIGCNCSFNDGKLCHIDRLVWNYKDLKGFLSEEVANLSYLEQLDLSYNEIQGSIPVSLGNMSRLYNLDLSNNQLTGRIPKELGNLKARAPNLSNNQLTGRIPNALGNLMPKTGTAGNPNMPARPCGKGNRYNRYCGSGRQSCPSFTLDLSNNYLDGSIPDSLGNIALDNPGLKLKPDSSCSDFSISLHDNHLTGSIPKSLGNLKFLTSLDLRRNLLSGPIHPSFDNMSSLRYLYLSENQLYGSLPSELGNLTSLRYLMLQSNYFTGDFPSSFGHLANLSSFSISGNYLSCPFPDVITNWTLIDDLSFQGNNFWGNIPSNIFNFSSLDSLIISDVGTTSFKFPETTASTYINTLVLRNCSITDYIPKFINGSMSSLEYLDLSFNNLVGGIPESMEHINFTYVSFANNLLSGPIPDWISSAAARTKMDLSFNNFSYARVELQKNPNMTLFSCCQSCNSTNCKPEMRNVDHLMMQNCPDGKPKHHSLYINCGGEQIDNMDGNNYDQDNRTSFSYGTSPKGYWAFTSSGSFLSKSTNSSDYIKKVKCGISVAEAPLYEKARLAPVSLKYYGYCLHNGTYNVTLHFAEIVYTEDDEDKSDDINYSLNKRIFDVYIQDKRVETDFNINREAGGPNKVARIENHTTVVNNGQLEIHLYWAGKGTSSDSRDSPNFNGPLLSAISVTPGFTLGEKKLSRLHIALITIASIVFAMLLLLAFAWIMGWLKKEELHDIRVSEDKTVTLNQLIAATRRFSKEMEIGKGGFGTVYKAQLPDHQIVAVKKLSTLSLEGIDKLKSEIYTLQSLRHENLVRLHDIYVGKGLYLLIYEYMENKSLADALFSPEHKVMLDWDARFNICLGIAKGLDYLHEHPRFKMVHRGIKAANILLDGTFNSKISDFGLASSYAESDNDAIRVIKTETQHGYMAPEYPMYGIISSKYDVYSFGVVTLELVSGRKNAGHKSSHEFGFLVDEVGVADTKGRLLDLVDKSLSDVYETKQVITILKLAVKCTNISPGVRPTMSQVVSVLTGEKTLDEISSPAASAEAEKTEQDFMEDLSKDVESSASA